MQLEPIDDVVTVLRLDGGKANAMNLAFLTGLQRLLDQLEASGARAAVIVGAGNAFSAGLDLPSLLPLDRSTLRGFIGLFEATMLRVFQIPRPVVAAVNGHAIAGGCVLALQADVRIAAAGNARIGLSEVAIGIGLPSSVMETLRGQLPPASLVPIALEARLCGVDEALSLGLVDEVVSPDSLLPRAIERARVLAAGGAAAFAQVKLGLRRPALEIIERRREVEAEAWLDTWFSPEGQRRLQAAVDRITSRARPS
jgi:enoyl-CoA hydratase